MAKDLMQMLAADIVLGDGGMFLEANWRGYDVPEIIAPTLRRYSKSTATSTTPARRFCRR